MCSTTMALNQTQVDEVHILNWIRLLTVPSVVILAIGFPICLTTFFGTLQAALTKSATLLEWVMSLFQFGLLQLCCFGQIGTLVRIVSHYQEALNIHVSCILSHFSMDFAASIIHTGLFTSIILRCIYIVYPRVGGKINQHLTLYKAMVTALLVGLALARGFSDYLYSETNVYRFCIADQGVSYKDALSTTNRVYTLTFFLVLVTVDLLVTARTWWAINLKSRQVQTTENSTQDQSPKLLPLITMTGAVYCRVVGTLAYFFFFFIRRFIPDESNPLKDHLFATIALLVVYAILTIFLPITFAVNSPFIKVWLHRKKRPATLPRQRATTTSNSPT